MIRTGVLLLAGISLLLLFSSPVEAEDHGGSVAGRVVNGTPGSEAPSNIEVRLRILRPGQAPEIRTTMTDGEGRFFFQDVPDDVSRYSLEANYLGVEYTLDAAPSGALSNLQLSVYEATTDMGNITIVSNSVLVLGADVRSGTLSLMELVRVANNGNRVFVPDPVEQMRFLRFPLPPGATNLDIQSELPQGDAVQVDRGFGMTTPVPPGEFGVAFSYVVPYEGTTFDFSRNLRYGAGTMRVLVPQSLGLEAAAAIEETGDTTIGGATFTLFQGTGIGPGESISMELEGLPTPSAWDRLMWRLEGNTGNVGVLSVLALGLCVLLVIGVRRRTADVTAAVAYAGAGRDELIRAIARLDDRYARGDIDAGTFEDQRLRLKARVVGVARRRQDR